MRLLKRLLNPWGIDPRPFDEVVRTNPTMRQLKKEAEAYRGIIEQSQARSAASTDAKPLNQETKQ